MWRTTGKGVHLSFVVEMGGGGSLAFTAGADLSDLKLLGGCRSSAIEGHLPHAEARACAARMLARGTFPDPA